MTTAVLGYSKAQRRIHSVKYRKTVISVSQKLFNGIRTKVGSIGLPAINWKVVCFMGFFVGLSLLVFYVWQINNLTQGSYLVNSYEKQISQLSDENKSLVISFAENSFLGQAFIKIQELNFQKISSTPIKYIRVLDSSAEAAQTDKNI